MRKALELEIRKQAAPLAINESITITCPFCEEDWAAQGKPFNWRPEQSFSITRTDVGILYNCYRASCHNGRGFISSLPGALTPRIKPAHKLKPFVHATINIPANIREQLKHEYYLTDDQIDQYGVKYVEAHSRIYLPIYNDLGAVVGCDSKRFPKLVEDDFPKTLTYWEQDSPELSWHPAYYHHKTAYVCEDILSMIRLSEYGAAVALLGTSMNSQKVSLLQQHFDEIHVCLDPDAIDKAFKLYMRCLMILSTFHQSN